MKAETKLKIIENILDLYLEDGEATNLTESIALLQIIQQITETEGGD